MSTFKYYIRNGIDKKVKIYIRFSYGRENLFRTSTGISIKTNKNWDAERERVKNILDEPNADNYNDTLNELRAYFISNYNQLISNGTIIQIEHLKRILKTFQKTPIVLAKQDTNDFIQCFANFIEFSKNYGRNKGKKITEGTIRTYKTTFNVIKEFERYRGKILFDDINNYFYYDLLNFLEKKGYSQNYIGKITKNLKTFLRHSIKVYKVDLKEYNPSDFVVLKEIIDEIYLNLEEVKSIFELNLSHLSPYYNYARDLFLIGCCTGLRVSEFNKLKKENIVLSHGIRCFQVYSKKTGKKLLIPVAPMAEKILLKYSDSLPAMSDQKINEHIKEIGKLAEIKEDVYITKTIGGKKVTKQFKKYELIKTHTARRSFCTNAYLGGLDSIEIMAISGHKTENVFLNYIKVTASEHAKKVANSAFFKSLS